jgi:hypothetical protein
MLKRMTGAEDGVRDTLTIYFVLARTFVLSSLDKWTSGGTPEYFIKQFDKTFLAKFPGVPFAYDTLLERMLRRTSPPAAVELAAR